MTETFARAKSEFTAEEKRKAAERELNRRRRHFPNRIYTGRMSQEEADYEVEIMATICGDYAAAAERERLPLKNALSRETAVQKGDHDNADQRHD